MTSLLQWMSLCYHQLIQGVCVCVCVCMRACVCTYCTYVYAQVHVLLLHYVQIYVVLYIHSLNVIT